MRRNVIILLILLTMSAGCLTIGEHASTPSQISSSSTPPSSQSMTDTATATTPTNAISGTSVHTEYEIAGEDAGERAIAAEEERIERVTADWENLSALYIGDIRQPEYTISDRNETGVTVIVVVGHSLSFEECNHYVDGATTRVQYFVTENSVRLLTIIEDVYGRYNRPC